MVVTRVGPLSCARVAAVLYGGLGLVLGAIFSLVSLAGAAVSGDADGPALGMVFGIAAIVVLPLLYAALGFVTTVVGAWLYNLAAGIAGGIEIDMK